MRRKTMKIAALSAALTIAMLGTAMAGEWKQDDKGWWWQFEDGSYLKGRSASLDANLDGMAETYQFDENGYLVTSTTNENGNVIDAEGRCLTKDGTVLELSVSTTYASTEPGTVGGYYLGDVGIADGNHDGVIDYEYTIYYGYAVKVIDENTISVLPDQFDNMEPMTFYKVAENVYEKVNSDDVDRIVFEGSNLRFTCGLFGEENLFKR